MKVYNKNSDLSSGKAFLLILLWVNIYCTVYVFLEALLYGTPLSGWLLVSPAVTAAAAVVLLAWRIAKAVMILTEPKRHGIIPADTICRIMGDRNKQN